MNRALRPAYAKSGGAPQRWHRLVVLDAVTREELRYVVEANAVEGWFVRQVRDAEGRLARTELGQPALEKISREIVICDVCADPDARDPQKPLEPRYDPNPETRP